MKRSRGRPVSRKCCVGCKKELVGAATIRAHRCEGLDKLLEARSAHQPPSDDEPQPNPLTLTKQRKGEEPAAIVLLDHIANLKENERDVTFYPSNTALSISGGSVVEDSFIESLNPVRPQAVQVQASHHRTSTPVKLMNMDAKVERNNNNKPPVVEEVNDNNQPAVEEGNNNNQLPVEENNNNNQLPVEENNNNQSAVEEGNSDDDGILMPKRTKRKRQGATNEPRKQLFLTELAGVIRQDEEDAVDFNVATIVKSQKGAEHLLFQGRRHRKGYFTRNGTRKTWRCCECNGNIITDGNNQPILQENWLPHTCESDRYKCNAVKLQNVIKVNTTLLLHLVLACFFKGASAYVAR